MVENDNDFKQSLQALDKESKGFAEKGGYEAFFEKYDELQTLVDDGKASDAEIALCQEFVTVAFNVYTKAFEEYKNIVTDKDYKDTSDSILAGLGQLVQPIFTPLGFGSNLNDNGWVFGVSAVTGLIAKENVIATFSVLAQCSESVPSDVSEYVELIKVSNDEEGVDASIRMIENTNIKTRGGWAALISFIVFNMTTIPCFAAVATAKGELDKKRFWSTILFWLGASYVSSLIVFVCLRWWWPIALVAALGVGLVFGIHYYNKYRDAKSTAKN